MDLNSKRYISSMVKQLLSLFERESNQLRFLSLFEMEKHFADFANEQKSEVILPHIFPEGQLRLAEPLMNGKKYEVEQIASQELSDFNIDWDQWVGYKLTDADKKNPMKLNKLLNKRKAALQKEAQQMDPEKDVKEIDALTDMVSRIDNLLKVSDLKKAYHETTTLMVVYSRAPIDTLRMSDHGGVASCHSPGGQYFSHAVADAGRAGVTYVVTNEDFQNIKNLQASEIFCDQDRGVEGIEPLARTRIRILHAEDGTQIGVPTRSTYGRGVIATDLHTQTLKFFRDRQQKQAESFREGGAEMRGGSYEDWGDGAAENFKKMFGFQPDVSVNKSDLYDVKDRFPELSRGDVDDRTEQVTDAIRNALLYSDELTPDNMAVEFYGEDGDFVISKSVHLHHNGDLERAKKILARVPGVIPQEIEEIGPDEVKVLFQKRIDPQEAFGPVYNQIDYMDGEMWGDDNDEDYDHEDDYDIDVGGVEGIWEEELHSFSQALGSPACRESEGTLNGMNAYYKLQAQLLGITINTDYISTYVEDVPEDDYFKAHTEIDAHLRRLFKILPKNSTEEEPNNTPEFKEHLQIVNNRLSKQVTSTSILPDHAKNLLIPTYRKNIALSCTLADIINFDGDQRPDVQAYKEIGFLTSKSFPAFLNREFNSLGDYTVEEEEA